MNVTRLVAAGIALDLVVTTHQHEAAALEVTLDSGLGTQTFTDVDGNVDFDTTVGGVFQARGTADDLVDLTVDIPAHSVSALANDGTLPLGTLAGAALTAPAGGSSPSNTA